MVTYGFYNSINHDRVYDATQMSEIFDGIIRDGVYEYVGSHFAVSVSDLSGFQVRVGTGRAWFNHTWTKNDAPLILTLPAPPTLDNYYRSDAIVIDINADVNVRENKITYVKGTEVADNPSPPRPALANGAHKQVALAYITRVGAETSISQANIQYVVGTDACPYVFSPVQAIDLTAHVAQWQAAWEEWFQGPNGYVQTQARAFEAEIAAAEAAIENATDDVNEDVAEFRVWIASQKSQFDGWMDSSKNDFQSWFRNIQYILDGNVAGHLQNEIDTLTNRVTPIENGGTGNSDGYIRTGFKDTESTLGDFSTSEGMNTVASGDCSHAEGGGNYSYQHQDNHFESDNLKHYTDSTDTDHYVDLSGTDGPPPSDRDYITVRGKSGSLTMSQAYGTGWRGHKFTSAYIGVILKNATTDEILKVDIGSIGPDCINRDDYIGCGPNYIKQYANELLNDQGSLRSVRIDNMGNSGEWYIDNKNLLDLFDPIDFIINLPCTGQMTRVADSSTLGYHTGYVSGTVSSSSLTKEEPFNPKTILVIDSVTNAIIALGEYDTTYQRLRVPVSYYKFFSVNNSGEPDYKLPINSDYSYNLTYINNNVQEHPYKMMFSNRTLQEIFPITHRSGDDIIYDINVASYGASIKISEDRERIDYNSGTFYLYNNTPGITYSFEVYLAYGIDNVDAPLVWIPAGDYIHINGDGTKAVGDYCHAEGFRTVSDGDGSHTEGRNTSTEGNASHAEGESTIAGDNFNNTYGDHAEGYNTTAISRGSGSGAHAEGDTTQALAGAAHAEGHNTIASGMGSHAGGIGAHAYFTGQFVHGTFGFGGNLEIIENQDKTYDLPSGVKAFSGGLFLMRNNTSLAKTLKIQLIDSINGILDRSRALWLMVIRDVPDETLPYTSNSYVGMFFIKYNIYATRSDNLPTWTAIKEEGSSSAFEFGTPISNESNYLPLKVKASNGTGYLNFEVQFIRIM